MQAPELFLLPDAVPFRKFYAGGGVVYVCVVKEGSRFVVDEKYPGPNWRGHAGNGGDDKVPLLVVDTGFGAELHFGAVCGFSPVEVEDDGGVEEVVDGEAFPVHTTSN